MSRQKKTHMTHTHAFLFCADCLCMPPTPASPSVKTYNRACYPKIFGCARVCALTLSDLGQMHMCCDAYVSRLRDLACCTRLPYAPTPGHRDDRVTCLSSSCLTWFCVDQRVGSGRYYRAENVCTSAKPQSHTRARHTHTHTHTHLDLFELKCVPCTCTRTHTRTRPSPRLRLCTRTRARARARARAHITPHHTHTHTHIHTRAHKNTPTAMPKYTHTRARAHTHTHTSTRNVHSYQRVLAHIVIETGRQLVKAA
jgi:hypothetical protein